MNTPYPNKKLNQYPNNPNKKLNDEFKVNTETIKDYSNKELKEIIETNFNQLENIQKAFLDKADNFYKQSFEKADNFYKQSFEKADNFYKQSFEKAEKLENSLNELNKSNSKLQSFFNSLINKFDSIEALIKGNISDYQLEKEENNWFKKFNLALLMVITILVAITTYSAISVMMSE